MFVSIHANYSDLSSARGVETYYTDFFSSPGSREIEKRENGEAKNTVAPTTLSNVGLQGKIEESRRLAASIQRALYGRLSVQSPTIRDRGVKEASFVVLMGTSMPSVLAEVSFVSSPTDEQNLESSIYRQQIAEARDAMARGPDIVLLDLVLPDGSGLDLLREHQGQLEMPVVVTTGQPHAIASNTGRPNPSAIDG